MKPSPNPSSSASPARMSRARFLAAGLAAAAPSRLAAADPTPQEQANLTLVTDFCNSFAGRDMDRIASFLADDIVYRIVETAQPLTGTAALDRIRAYVERSPTIEFKILDSYVKGPVVVNERIDTFISPERTNAYHLTGVFFVRGGEIAEWTDYSIPEA